MKSTAFLLLGALMSPFFASAAPGDMTFHGTLVAPPCKISHGGTIEVPFGDDLGIGKIDGVNYLRKVDYTIDCDTGYTQRQLAIVVESTHQAAGTWPDGTIDTTLPGLGIQIKVEGVPVVFGTRIAVSDTASPPLIQAVPVKDSATLLNSGAFESTMTLRVDYF